MQQTDACYGPKADMRDARRRLIAAQGVACFRDEYFHSLYLQSHQQAYSTREF
jgi:hypothetical protein